MASNTTVLITGAGRGIGRGLAEAYLARPNHTVIAAVRDPASANAQSLQSAKTASGSKLLLVKIDSASDTDAAAAVETIQAAGIRQLDIVIANAATGTWLEPVAQANLATARDIFEVNTFGPVKLFQATLALLKAAAAVGQPKFVAISSVAGSTAGIGSLTKDFGVASYGASKAALNHYVRRAFFENEWLTAVVVQPGWVQSDSGNASAKMLMGMEKAPLAVDECAEAVLKLIDNATRESNAPGAAGFWNYDGKALEY